MSSQQHPEVAEVEPVEPNDQHVSLYVTQSLKARMDRLALADHRSIASWLRKAITEKVIESESPSQESDPAPQTTR